jgi:hypothetical protein
MYLYGWSYYASFCVKNENTPRMGKLPEKPKIAPIVIYFPTITIVKWAKNWTLFYPD